MLAFIVVRSMLRVQYTGRDLTDFNFPLKLRLIISCKDALSEIFVSLLGTKHRALHLLNKHYH